GYCTARPQHRIPSPHDARNGRDNRADCGFMAPSRLELRRSLTRAPRRLNLTRSAARPTAARLGGTGVPPACIPFPLAPARERCRIALEEQVLLWDDPVASRATASGRNRRRLPQIPPRRSFPACRSLRFNQEAAAMSDSYGTVPEDTDRMPSGVPYIIGNEAAERFSFYGMRSILYVFMTEWLA